MSHPFSSFCEDFYVNMRVGSQLPLPQQRETLLHFFERVGKDFPGMTRFRKNDSGEYSLEEDRSGNSYRWLSLESKRISSGFVNPGELAQVRSLHKHVLEMAPAFLGLSNIEIDYLDVLFGFDLPFAGNHDEIIAESLYPQSPLTCLLEESGSKAIDYQPTVTVSLSDDCRLQARIDVVTRTDSQQVRSGDFADDVISVYLIIRRYWGDRPRMPLEKMYETLVDRADALANTHIVPKVLRPISSAIASRS
jgi:hypothetical protein